MIKTLDLEMRGHIKAINDREIQHLYYDWNLQHQKGVFVWVKP